MKQNNKNCYSIYNKSRITDYNSLYNNNHFEVLNKEIEKKKAKDFEALKNNNSNCSQSDIVYYSPDPRLINAVTSDRLLLDTPPYDTSIHLSDIYNENLRNYGKNYNSYKDINTGQIIYYINNRNDPIFNIDDIKTVYTNPMGSTYQEFCNIPKIQNNPLTDTINPTNGLCFPYMNDTMKIREDATCYAQSNINKIIVNRG